MKKKHEKEPEYKRTVTWSDDANHAYQHIAETVGGKTQTRTYLNPTRAEHERYVKAQEAKGLILETYPHPCGRIELWRKPYV